MAKYGMSMCVLGHAEEFRSYGIAVNALWPRTVILTAALQMIPGVKPEHCRTPDIMADAAHAVLTSEAATTTGNFFIDEIRRPESLISAYWWFRQPPVAADPFVGSKRPTSAFAIKAFRSALFA
jgi:NAD(P)-dependent dehydrogenase (short-subunit alcohol dehydrogenase family)